MMFWQLTIDANDPAVLARFWAQALGYQPVPPTEPATAWHARYHAAHGAADRDRRGEGRPTDRAWAPACSTEPGTTTRRTRPTSRSCTTQKATSSSSAETHRETQARIRATHTGAHGWLLPPPGKRCLMRH